jgi:hypothetical protein
LIGQHKTQINVNQPKDWKKINPSLIEPSLHKDVLIS